MNKQDFLKALLPVGEYYSKNFTDGLIAVYYEQAKELDSNTFESLIKKHMSDTDQGRFWPTFAHLAAQAGTEDDVMTQSGIDFDNNPKIDGTISFHLARESVNDRAGRRKIYSSKKRLEWKKTDPVERIKQHKLLENAPALEKPVVTRKMMPKAGEY